MSPKSLFKSKSLDEKRHSCLSFFTKLNTSEENHRQLLESSAFGIRLKLAKVFQREIEKSYLSIFQMSSNARRLTGMLYLIFMKKAVFMKQASLSVTSCCTTSYKVFSLTDMLSW